MADAAVDVIGLGVEDGEELTQDAQDTLVEFLQGAIMADKHGREYLTVSTSFMRLPAYSPTRFLSMNPVS